MSGVLRPATAVRRGTDLVMSGRSPEPSSPVRRAEPRITVPEFEDLVAEKMPVAGMMGIRTEAIGYGTARLRLPVSALHLRPGGTVAGPALMGLADTAIYAVVLGMIGPVELAVTTSFTCNFLRRPPPADIVAEGRILKMGARLAVGEVSLFSADSPDAVAHVTATYSIPPRPG
jgi:uncharacterized protein (TIGR00369 family)